MIAYYEPEIITAFDYYPFGMMSRMWYDSDYPNYRFGFNGKEMDHEAKGNFAQLDYGMRVYDPRAGRFLSVDPISKDYPELTPYQYASNRPIDGIDLDGLEYAKHIFGKQEYNGSWGWFDWLKAIPNATAELGNGVIDIYNSGVSNYQSLRRGTWLSDAKKDFNQLGTDIKNSAIQTYNYHTTTPIKQQLRDAGDYFSSPQILEDVLIIGGNFYIGNKFGTGKGNILKTDSKFTSSSKTIVNTETKTTVKSTSELAEGYAKNRPTFRTGVVKKVWENAKDINGKVFDPNTFEELTWDTFKSRFKQWHMGHKPGFEYRRLVDRLKTGEITKKQFLDDYNNLNNYRPESPSANMSHKYEAPKKGG